jgi:hypothetical protein
VAKSNHANSEGNIQTLTQKKQVKQQNFSQKVQLDILWLRVGCATLYLDHGCTNYPKPWKKSQNYIARNVT